MSKPVHPPVLAERILARLLDTEDAESVLGDFAEMYASQKEHGNADGWYWKELFRSFPFLFQRKLTRQFERIFTVMTEKLQKHNKVFLWFSLLALMPALLLVVPGIFQSFGNMAPNDTLDRIYTNAPILGILGNPVILLSGLLLVIILNLSSALKLHFERQTDGLIGVITFKPVLLHWAFVGMSLLMVTIIAAYLFLENFVPFK